ncbi:MAG: hypothetical protein C1O27_001448 [Chloroflexi bacterium]|nr:MAG: hypothetical protein C1O27_001448 [Chloroflexota bacterium]
MYILRRIYKAKAGQQRKVAELVAQASKAYEEAGQRAQTQVYTSGGTVPGPANLVYLQWVAEKIESPYREGNKIPSGASDVGAQIRELVEESSIEFYEMYPKP